MTRRCAFCPEPELPPITAEGEAMRLLWAPRIAQCLAHADSPRSERPTADLLISQHITRAKRAGGEEFAPWTPERAAVFLARPERVAA